MQFYRLENCTKKTDEWVSGQKPRLNYERKSLICKTDNFVPLVVPNRFHRDGKVFQGAERSMCKALGSWWRDKNIYRSKTLSMTTKCKRVRSHVYSTVLNSSINWPWSGAMINKVRAWESQILRLTFRPRRMPGESWVTCKVRTPRFMRVCWRKMGMPLQSEKIGKKIWTSMSWAVYDGDVPIMLAPRTSFLLPLEHFLVESLENI